MSLSGLYPNIEGYDINSILGEGGMGRVYRATRNSDGREVAIKVVHPKLTGGAAKECLHRFVREIEVSKNLSHPSVVLILDGGGLEGEFTYVVMELLNGQPLDEASKEKPLPEEQCFAIAHKLAEALNYIHEQGLIHRDIKPANVFLESDGRVVLLDFGLVLDTNRTRMTKTGNLVGTLMTLAPEVLREEGATPKSDIYSLGVTLYYAATGSWPYDRNDVLLLANEVDIEPPPALHIIRKDFSPVLSKIIMKAFSQAPERRYKDGQELLEAITALEKPITITEDNLQSAAVSAVSITKQNSSFLLRSLLLCGLILLIILVASMVKGPDKKGTAPSELIASSDMALLRDALLSSKEPPTTEDASNLGFILRKTGIAGTIKLPLDDDDEIVGMRYLGEYTLEKKDNSKSFEIYYALLERRGPYASVEKYSKSTDTIMGRAILSAGLSKRLPILLAWLRKFHLETIDFQDEWQLANKFWIAGVLVRLAAARKVENYEEHAKEALQLLEELLSRNSFDTEVFEHYCQALRDIGDMDLKSKSVKFLEGCMARKPTSADEGRMRLALGSMLLIRPKMRYDVIYKSHLVKAVEQLEKAYPLVKGTYKINCCFSLTQALHKVNRTEEALRILNDLNPKTLPTEKVFWYYRAKAFVFRADNKFDEAMRVYEEGMEVVPLEDRKGIKRLQYETMLEKMAAGTK